LHCTSNSQHKIEYYYCQCNLGYFKVPPNGQVSLFDKTFLMNFPFWITVGWLFCSKIHTDSNVLNISACFKSSQMNESSKVIIHQNVFCFSSSFNGLPVQQRQNCLFVVIQGSLQFYGIVSKISSILKWLNIAHCPLKINSLLLRYNLDQVIGHFLSCMYSVSAD